jgi:hypothetical protein
MKIIIYRYHHPLENGKWLYTGQTTNLRRRDCEHRKGAEGFGRLFKKTFPDVELPKPDSCEIDVVDHLEANFEETVAIFRNHTWHGEGGWNFGLPGAADYKTAATAGGTIRAMSGDLQRIASSGGKARKPLPKEHYDMLGRNAVESGHCARIASSGGLISGRLNAENGWIQSLGRQQGRKNVESGQLSRISKLPQTKAAQRRQAYKMHELPQTKMAQKRNGRKLAESGQLAKNMHNYWHSRRSILKPEICKFCREVSQGMI